MYRKVLGIVGIGLVSGLGFCETEVSGIIDKDSVWSKAGSPYIVTGHVLVDTYAVLTIEKGVEVKVDSGKYIMVKGRLEAIGEEGDSILFVRNGTYRWDGIRFFKIGKGKLSYCRIEGGKITGEWEEGGEESDTLLVVRDCEFKESYLHAGSENGGRKGVVIVEGNSFEDFVARDDLINIWNVGRGEIKNNRMINLTVITKSVLYFILVGTGNSIITGNIISNCTVESIFGGMMGGIIRVHSPEFRVEDVRIEDNVIENIRRGEIVVNSYLFVKCAPGYSDFPIYIRNNRFVVPEDEAGGGLSILFLNVYPHASYNIENNHFIGEDVCIQKWSYGDSSKVVMCENTVENGEVIFSYETYTGENDVVVIQRNEFINSVVKIDEKTGYLFSLHYNSFKGAKDGYVLKVTNESDVDARFNYWGTSLKDSIDLIIFDYFDDFAKGRVFYEPFSEASFGSISGTVRADTIMFAIIRAFDTVGEIWDAYQILNGDSVYEYTLTELKPGSYYVEVIPEEGFICEFYDDVTEIEDATLVNVEMGDTTSGIDFVIEREEVRGRISGKVVEEGTGESMSFTLVYAIPVGELLLADFTIADEEGNYVLNVEEGKNYYVFAIAPSHIGEFYPNAYTVEDAQQVGAGSKDIDFELASATGSGAGGICGKIQTIGATPIEGALIYALDENGNIVGSARSDAKGDYYLQLAPGTYRVKAVRCGYEEGVSDDVINIDRRGKAYFTGIDIELEETAVEESGKEKVKISFKGVQPTVVSKGIVEFFYCLPPKGVGELEVYNVSGRLVKKMEVSGKVNKVSWDLTNEKGRKVANGVYFVKFKAQQFEKTAKFLIVK